MEDKNVKTRGVSRIRSLWKWFIFIPLLGALLASVILHALVVPEPDISMSLINGTLHEDPEAKKAGYMHKYVIIQVKNDEWRWTQIRSNFLRCNYVSEGIERSHVTATTDNTWITLKGHKTSEVRAYLPDGIFKFAISIRVRRYFRLPFQSDWTEIASQQFLIN